MTDKPIMIDGVDVAECFHFDKDDYANKNTSYCMCDGNMSDICQENPNCYYKQLKRKEQECDQLKKELDITSCANIELSLEIKKYEKAIDEIEEIADNNYENPEMQRIFNIIGGLDV